MKIKVTQNEVGGITHVIMTAVNLWNPEGKCAQLKS